ncbi:SHOCT domain-containing protein [Eubacteriaceae bacterium ES2]|nr:SHOCT domain-containing protein [Eubacteriaceae bacterium ES2]
MGFKELIQDVTDLAQDSIDSIQSEIALQKESQQKLREEMNRRISSFTQSILNKLTEGANSTLLLANQSDVIVSYTEAFYQFFYLPANNTASSKLTFYPDHQKALKSIKKYFSTYTDDEQFLMQFKDDQGQSLVLTTGGIHFKVLFPENSAFYAIGKLEKKNLSNLNLVDTEDSLAFLINGYPLILIPKTSLNQTDTLSLFAFLKRLNVGDFVITNDQIHDFILSKLDSLHVEQVTAHLASQEKLLYFAWGLDNMNSNKFLICTTAKIFIYDEEISLEREFFYNEITDMTTEPSSINLFDLSLSIGVNPNDIIIKSANETETISILYQKEAQHVINLFSKYKTLSNTNDDPLTLLEQLGTLKEKGILTEDEFLEKKKELLSKI